MASIYGEKELFKDARKKWTRSTPCPDFAEVWTTVDRYVASCLEQTRGVALPNFCRIGWQKPTGGSAKRRPYFEVSDSFRRTVGIGDMSGASKALSSTETFPIEEFSFSKAAIKFSSILTKDAVFSGLRLLVSQLAQVVAQHRHVVLEFTFGKFLAKDKALRFDFSPSLCLAHGLDLPDAAEAEALQPSATFAPPGSASKLLCLQGSNANSVVSNRSSIRQQQRRSQDSDVLIVDGSVDDQNHAVESVRHQELMPLESALHREISLLEERANKALCSRDDMQAFSDNFGAEELTSKADKHAKARAMAEMLHHQVELKRAKQQVDILGSEVGYEAWLNPKPQGQTCEPRNRPAVTRRRRLGPDSPVDLNYKNDERQVDMTYKEELDKQVQEERARKSRTEASERQLEAACAQQHANFALQQAGQRQAQKARERELLAAAWNEDAKMREMRRVIEALENGKRMPLSARSKQTCLTGSHCGRGTPRGGSFGTAAALALTPRTAAVG